MAETLENRIIRYLKKHGPLTVAQVYSWAYRVLTTTPQLFDNVLIDLRNANIVAFCEGTVYLRQDFGARAPLKGKPTWNKKQKPKTVNNTRQMILL